MMQVMKPVHVITAVLLTIVAPRIAQACPVCFGQNDSPLSAAITVGVAVMLGFVVVVLGGFAAFFVYLNRRARLAAAQADEQPFEPSEGTVQC